MTDSMWKVIELRDAVIVRLLAVPFANAEARFRALCSFLSYDDLEKIAEQWEQSL